MVIAHVQSLMSEDDCLPIGRSQVRLQPLQLRSGNVGVIPLRVLAAIRFAVIAKTGIQNHKMKIASIERIVGLLLLNSTQELGLRKRVDAMISEHIMTIFRDGTQLSINLLEAPLLGLNGIRSVDENRRSCARQKARKCVPWSPCSRPIMSTLKRVGFGIPGRRMDH